jgi:serine/threonine protein kinase
MYAMKTLNKLYTLRQKEQAFFMEERDVLVHSMQSKWMPKLHAAFQDEENVFLVMEFVSGGDLFSLLARQEVPILEEDAAKFYMAELVLAVEELHSMGYVHRDLKPSNILIDSNGHVKLADFGSCIKLDEQGQVTSTVPVGTCDYISPEVLQAREGNTSYGKECDWWSIGILLHEILYGDPPFYSDTIAETYGKIMAHAVCLACMW